MNKPILAVVATSCMLLLLHWLPSNAQELVNFGEPDVSVVSYRPDGVYRSDLFRRSERIIEKTQPYGQTEVQEQRLTSVQSDRIINASTVWLREISANQTNRTGVGAFAVLKQDSVLTFVGQGASAGTTVLRISESGNIVHLAAMIPDTRDTVWRPYFTATDAKLRENGDIALAGFVRGANGLAATFVGAPCTAEYTTVNRLVVGPHRYYTQMRPDAAPPDIHRVVPISGRFVNGDTVVFELGDRDRGSPAWGKRWGLGRLPGNTGDTNLIVWHPDNAVDAFQRETFESTIGGGAFVAFENQFALWSAFYDSQRTVKVQYRFVNTALSIGKECVLDSMGLFSPIVRDNNTVDLIYWNQAAKSLQRRVLRSSCTASERETLYRSEFPHIVDYAFYRPNGNLVLCGMIYRRDNDSPANIDAFYEKAFAMELSTEGRVVWSYQRGRDEWPARIQRVVELEDSSFILLGNYDYSDTFITRIKPTGPSSVSDSFRDEFAVVSPNPLQGGESISLTLPVAGEFLVEVRDLSGRLIADAVQLRFDANTSQHLPFQDLGAGVYFVTAQSGSSRFTSRLVKF